MRDLGAPDGETRTRTGDTTIFSRVLYQLSYLAVERRGYRLHRPRRGLPFRAVSRRILALVAVAVAAIAVATVLIARGGSKDEPAPTSQGDTRAEALSYAPRSSPALVGVDTGSAAASLVLGALVPRVSGGALSANDVSPLLGNEAVVAVLDPRTQRAQLSMVAKDPDALRALTRHLAKAGAYNGASLYRAARGAVLAVKGDAVVAASDEPTVRRAIDTAANGANHLTPAQFDARLAGLPKAADVRAVFDPKRVVVATRLPGVLTTRWGRSLTNGAAVLQEGGPGLQLPFVLQTDAARINDADLPFGTGTTPPQMHGRAPLLIGVKDFARFIAFLRKADPQRLGGLDSLQNGLPSFLRVNIDGLLGGLTGDGTVSSDDGLAHFAARTDPPNPDDWRTPLNRLSTLSSVLQSLGIDNVKLSEEPGGGDAYRLEIDGKLTARVGIFGPTLVITDAGSTDLRATANAPAVPPPPGAAGGLTLRLQASEGRRLLGSLFGIGASDSANVILDRFGDLTGWASAATDGVRGTLQLGLR